MSVLKTTTGLALAVAAAGMMGCAAHSTSQQAGAEEVVHCYGVNKCAGHNDCKTADNACKGQGSCKGKGFVSMSAEACADVGGKVVSETSEDEYNPYRTRY
ncbi:hypothetical protein [Methylophaga sp. OBS4]|uniref:BufA2 family periplasmic bufferin-type metallophore n=1 Tax=Methylophaga sp. OBS4 TaxID=2991935 RepID=UPI00224E5A3E|nr:hypothetical protein [Methylophaga sp. OBS4]MCX4186686.1 hypothetical protein [Methylophaga sp. OBS4]